MLDCNVLKESIYRYLQAEIEVISKRHVCILSLPLRGLNGVNAEVFVEEVHNGSLLVHDGGKTIGFLESNGLLVTESRLTRLADLAYRLNVSLVDGVFTTIAKPDTIQISALAVGQCCSVALSQILDHIPFSEEEQIRAKVTAEVERWSSDSGIRVREGVALQGSVKQYKIDFVANAPTPIEVSVLIPTYSATVSADRYALQVLDLKASRGDISKRLAVLAKPEKWTRPARIRVEHLSDQLAEVSLRNTLLPTGIRDALDILVTAA